ncbi:leucine-rich repeat-domain-containing protein [Cladochytrium replicatum]|nr:leucine-rich repeat-domain-containing protein [Cladochytrium replicatum]
MKLDFDVLSVADSRINPVGDRELDLRGLKIQLVENLAMTRDQHDAIEFTDNDLRRLENFPSMPRLKTLFLASNRISRIDHDIVSYIPNIQTLILTNNQMQELGDLDALAGFKHLVYLSLTDNPVSLKKHYRHYVIRKCPSVRVLDFRRVRQKERLEAAKLFSGSEGTRLEKSLSGQKSRAKTFEVGEPSKKVAKPYQGPSREEAEKIKRAIENAKSLDEVARLERQLRGGVVQDVTPADDSIVEVEMDD